MCSIGQRLEQGPVCSTAGVAPAASRGWLRIVAPASQASTLPKSSSQSPPSARPRANFRVGDLEALPWLEDSFDVVTGFSSFQFADDKVRAFTEARRVSRGLVAVVIPSRVSESGIAAVFKPLFPLFPPEALESMKHSGMFALSEPGKLEEVLAAAGLTVDEDDEIESLIIFDDAAGAVRAFVGAGPTALAIGHSGELAVTQAVREALGPFTGTDGRVTLPAYYRVVIARA